MTPKQKTFVREYAVDMHATNAAMRAGYSEKTAAAQSSRLLRNVKIAEAVSKTQKDHADRCNVNVDILTDELETARKVAEENGQAGAMVSAIMSKAKLHGLLIDASYREVSEQRGPIILWGNPERK